MSRRLLALFACALAVAPAMAQDSATYGPEEEQADAAEPAPRTQQEAQERCEESRNDESVIVVCAPPDGTDAYLSPLPTPARSDKRTVPEIHEPPCWVTKSKSLCIRFGSVPEYPPLIDLTQFPERLSDEDAEKVFAVESQKEPETLTGKRVPIDLGDD